MHIEELRRLAAAPVHDLGNYDLEVIRTDALRQVDHLLHATVGRARKADEQRALDRANEVVDLVDKIMLADYNNVRRAQTARQNEAQALRLASGLYADRSARSDLGDRLAAAIDEVRDGRALATVEVDQTRALYDANAGGYGVPSPLGAPVSNMKARSIVMGLPGITTVPMSSDRMRWPRFGTATAAATAEGSTLTAANTDLDAVDLLAAKYGTLETISTELSEDFSADALAAIGENLLRQLAIRVDLGLLEGLGASDAVGIRNVVGANSTSLAGTPTNFATFRTAEYELRLDNGNPVVWVMHPRTWTRLQAVKTGIASDETTLLQPDPQQGPRTLLGYPVAFSSQITLVEGATTAGSWAALIDTSQLVIGERRPATLEVSRDYGFANDTIGIRATWRGGLAALNPEAISLVTDIR